MKLSLLVFLFIAFVGCTFSQASLKLSANYETIGVTLLLDVNDPEKDAFATIEYKVSSSDLWIEGFPLSRVNNELNMCSGSIFWLTDNTHYDIRVRVIDSTTNAIDGDVMEASISTKAEPNFETESENTLMVNPSGEGAFYGLQEAIDLAQAGDLILLDTGTYFVGNITFPNNGDALNPIRIRGVEKDRVILNGAYEVPLTWTPFGANGVYQTSTPEVNPNLIIADGVRMYPHQTFTDLVENKITLNFLPQRDYPADIPGFYRNPTLLPLINFGDPVGITRNKLYIKFLDGASPDNKNIKVTKQATCFKLENNQYIEISNLTFKNYGLGHIATAIVLTNSSNIIINSCVFKANNTSIRLNKATENILIQDSEFVDYFFNWHSWTVKSTQDFAGPFNARFPLNSRNLEKGSMIVGHDFSGGNIVFRRNKIRDYHQGGSITPAPPAVSVLDTMRKSLDIDFYENTIIDCRGDGFEIDGFARNVRVFKNYFDGCHAPLSLAAAEEGPLYVLRNTFTDIIPDYYDSGFDLSEAKGHPLKFQVGGNLINGDIFFYHNTVDAQNIAYGMNVFQVTTTNAWKKLDSKNNIFNTDLGVALNVRTISGLPNFTSDYNSYFANNADVFCVTLDNSSPSCFGSLSDLSSTYGWDEHSIEAVPSFVDAESGDYRLDADSDVIDSGIIIQGINEMDYFGIKPDMGAFETENSVSLFQTDYTMPSIYPNPAADFLIIDMSNDGDKWTYFIFDIYGQLWASSEINSDRVKINLTALSSGTYVVQLKNKYKILSTKMMISR